MEIRRAVAAASFVVLAACSSAAQPARTQLPTDVVATVGSVPITLGELDERALFAPASKFGGLSLAQALFEARREALDLIVGDRLIDAEAKARGLDRAALVDQEITAKAVFPADADVAAWYASNQDRVNGAPFDSVSPAIREMLAQQNRQTARTAFLDRLKASTPVTITLEPPRVDVAHAGRPAKGPADAPVQIIEFSDFQCPFCFRANPTVAEVLKTYGDRIRFVYRHYPLPNHPNARPAAEAAACAEEQGKFWEFHDRLFADQSRLSDADLKQHAAELGLDAAKFNECFDTHKFQSLVDEDMDAALAAGVSGTPAFFINGRPLSGAQPFENFKRVIDEELQRNR
jgi:protein-disulfide isomerase